MPSILRLAPFVTGIVEYVACPINFLALFQKYRITIYHLYIHTSKQHWCIFLLIGRPFFRFALLFYLNLFCYSGFMLKTFHIKCYVIYACVILLRDEKLKYPFDGLIITCKPWESQDVRVMHARLFQSADDGVDCCTCESQNRKQMVRSTSARFVATPCMISSPYLLAYLRSLQQREWPVKYCCRTRWG